MKNQTYTGYETWIHSIKMSMKMNMFIFIALTVAYLLTIGIHLYLAYSVEFLTVLAKWLVSVVLANSFLSKFTFNVLYKGEYVQMYAYELYEWFYETAMHHLILLKAFSIKSLLVYAGYIPIKIFFRRKAREHTKDDYKRGAKILRPAELNKQTKNERRYFEFGEAKMPVSTEIKHTFVIGRTGAGKTLLTNNVVEKIRQRGNKAIIYDYKGDYVSRFYNPETDLLFNPLDSRSVNWNIFSDMHTPMDISSMVASLIPDMQRSSQPFFNLAARDVLSGVISHLFQTNQKNYSALWATLTKSPEELSVLLKTTKGGTAGAVHISDPSNKQTGSVLSTMHLYTKIFEYFKDSDALFSIEEWVRNGSGILFISNYDKLKETLKPVLTMFIDTLATNLLSLPDDEQRRMFFVLDEFGTLQKMQRIVELLALSHSKGGSVYLGIQDVGQLDSIYGRELRNSIVNACGTNALFGVNDPDTADFLSRKIGEAEYKSANKGYTVEASEIRTAVSLGKQSSKEALFLPSELMQFPDLNCYVKFPNYSGCVTTLKRKSYPAYQDSFVMREDLSLVNVYWDRQQLVDELNINSIRQKQVETEKF